MTVDTYNPGSQKLETRGLEGQGNWLKVNETVLNKQKIVSVTGTRHTCDIQTYSRL